MPPQFFYLIPNVSYIPLSLSFYSHNNVRLVLFSRTNYFVRSYPR